MTEKAENTYQGRDQFIEEYNQTTFNNFMDSISHPEEWVKWKVLVEGDLMIKPKQLIEAMSKLSTDTALMIDHENKIIHFMNKETYNLNCD